MLILNCGMETVEFGYNSNSKDKKLGGYYSIEPNQAIDVPEEARIMIENSTSTPYKRGVMILGYGADKNEIRLIGFNRYLESLREALNFEQRRTAELEQVGVKMFGPRREIVALEKKIAKAEEALKELELEISTAPTQESYGNSASNGEQGKKKSGRSFNEQSAEIQL